MTSFDFINPDNGQRIVVRGPATLTREQAKKIFDQQRQAGALVSLNPGESITAQAQLAAGLFSAQAEILQSVVQNTAVISNTTPAKIIRDALLSSLDTDKTVTVANYAKQIPATTGLGNLSEPELTGVLAQVKKLNAQPADVATVRGVGEFDLSPEQLETQGYIKPGTVASYITNKRSNILSVLKSPQVWTGKDSINSLRDLLSNRIRQQKIQEQAMQDGISSLTEVGLPVEQLPAQAQAGVALSAAQNADATRAWLQGQAIDVELKTKFNNNVRYSAYAVEFSDSKINDPLRGQETARQAFAVTKREQIDAAVNRIIGNNKVSSAVSTEIAVDPAQTDMFNRYESRYEQIKTKLATVNQQIISIQNISARESQLNSQRIQTQNLISNVQELQISINQTSTVLSDRIVRLLIDLENLKQQIEQSLVLIQRLRTQFQLQ